MEIDSDTESDSTLRFTGGWHPDTQMLEERAQAEGAADLHRLIPYVATYSMEVDLEGGVWHRFASLVKQEMFSMRKVLGNFLLPKVVYDRWRYYWFGEVITQETEGLGVNLMSEVDDNTAVEPTDLNPFPHVDEVYEFNHRSMSRRDRFRFCTHLAAACKNEIAGITVETVANRLVAQRWLQKAMVERGMRIMHITQMLPLAVEAVFIPNQYELEAVQIAQSHVCTTTYIGLQSPEVLS